MRSVREESPRLKVVEFGTEAGWRGDWRNTIRFALRARSHASRGLHRMQGVALPDLRGNELKALIRKTALISFGVPSRKSYLELKRKLKVALEQEGML